MANAALKLFQALMDERDMKMQVMDEDEGVCRVGFNLEQTEISIFVKFGEDCTDAHFVGHDFVKIPENKKDIVYKLCNQCNSDFRWVKFVWDEENARISMQCDAVIQLDSCAEETFEIVMRMARIADQSYPTFMKAMWA